MRVDGYISEMLFMSSHSGTHMDAPYHFDEEGLRIHQLPLSRLMGCAFLLDMPKGARQAITDSDIQEYQKIHGSMPYNSAIIFHTGWQSHLHDADYFTHNPGLAPSAAEYLASKHTSLVGIDAPSIDVGGDSLFPAHKILARCGTINVENLANLGKIESPTFQYVFLPLNMATTGSPIRALAVLPD